MKDATYNISRDKIKSGDIILIHGGKAIFSKLIMFLTRSKYSHTGIAVWVKSAGVSSSPPRLIIVESYSFSKLKLSNLSVYAKQGFSVYSAPKKWGTGLENKVFGSMFGTVGYSWWDAAYIALRESLLKYFNIAIPHRDVDNAGMVCSEFVASAYDMQETSVSPQRLKEMLDEGGCEYRLEVRS